MTQEEREEGQLVFMAVAMLGLIMKTPVVYADSDPIGFEKQAREIVRGALYYADSALAEACRPQEPRVPQDQVPA